MSNINPPNPKQRYGDTKIPLGLVPSAAIAYEALAFRDGADKYGAYNWRVTGVETMTYIHAMMRHLQDYLDGEDLAHDSGYPHLGHIRACAGILIDATECGMLIDNRPPKGPAPIVHAEWQKPLDDEWAGYVIRDGYVYNPAGLICHNCSACGKLPGYCLCPDNGEEACLLCGEDPEDGPTNYTMDEAGGLAMEKLMEFRDLLGLGSVEADADCPLDHRNCDHGPTVAPTSWSENYIPSSDPGDETTYTPAHIHRWRAISDDQMACSDRGCGEVRTIVDQKPGQYALDLKSDPVVAPVVEANPNQYAGNETRKHPCNCRDVDRCRIENGNHVGNNVFCCKAEGSR